MKLPRALGVLTAVQEAWLASEFSLNSVLSDPFRCDDIDNLCSMVSFVSFRGEHFYSAEMAVSRTLEPDPGHAGVGTGKEPVSAN